MAKTTTIPNVQNANMPDGSILPADTTSKKTIFTAGANDSILRALAASSTDTSDRTINLYVNVGGAGTDRLVATILIPLNSGNSATISAVDLFHALTSSAALMPFLPLDAYGNKVWMLKAGTTIKVACTTTVTTAKELDFFGDGADF
jgi:hypothetical protein